MNRISCQWLLLAWFKYKYIYLLLANFLTCLLDGWNKQTVTQFFLFVCSWSAGGQKDDTTEGADLTLFPHPHPDPLPARQTRHSITLNTAPCRCFGAAKECLNYKYIYINIPCLYSSKPLHPPTSLPLTSWILTTTYVFFFSISLSLLLDILMMKEQI